MGISIEAVFRGLYIILAGLSLGLPFLALLCGVHCRSRQNDFMKKANQYFSKMLEEITSAAAKDGVSAQSMSLSVRGQTPDLPTAQHAHVGALLHWVYSKLFILVLRE